MSANSLQELRALKPEILRVANECGVQNIRVFGSAARGDMHEKSDVDFMVEWVRPSFDNYLAFKQSMRQLLGREVDVVELASVRNPLRREYMLKDATPL